MSSASRPAAIPLKRVTVNQVTTGGDFASLIQAGDLRRAQADSNAKTGSEQESA